MTSNIEQIALQQIDHNQPSRIVNQRRQTSCGIKTYLAVLSCNVLSLSCGLCFGWTSVLTFNFNNFVEEGIFEYADLPFIHAALLIAATVIPLFVTVPVIKFGRKVLLIGSAIALLMSFLLFLCTRKAVIFYIARALQGIGVGTAFTVLPMYLSEISSNEMRGLGTGSMLVFIKIGGIIPTFLNGLLSINIYLSSFFCLIPLIIFLVIFSWWNPESPVFLASLGKHQQLQHSLEVLQKNVDEERQDIFEYLQVVNYQRGIKNLFRKGFFLVLLLFICQCVSGELFFSTYVPLKFYEFYMPKSLIFLLKQLLVLIIAPGLALFTVDRFGRKTLLLISTLGSTILSTIMSICFYLHFGYNYYLSIWTIFVFHTLFLFFFNFGLAIVPWIILGEYIAYPQKAIAFALIVSCHFASNMLFGFLFSHFMFQMRGDLVTGILAITNLATVGFVMLLIPETKRKSLHEIQRLLYRNE